MKLHTALICIPLLLSAVGCKQTDQSLQAEASPTKCTVTQEDIATMEEMTAIAAQYLHSGEYFIEYANLPKGIQGDATLNSLRIDTCMASDPWQVARVVTHEVCHAAQYNQGRSTAFDWISPYHNRWQEVECKGVMLDGATYIFATLGKPLPEIQATWEDYYFHTQLLTEFQGKANILYYPETYITTWQAAEKSCYPYTFTQE